MMVTMTTMFLFLLFMTPVTMPLHTAEHKVTCMNPQVEESHRFIDISYYRFFSFTNYKTLIQKINNDAMPVLSHLTSDFIQCLLL